MESEGESYWSNKLAEGTYSQHIDRTVYYGRRALLGWATNTR